MLSGSKLEDGDEHASDKDMIRHLAEAQETIGATLAGLGEIADSLGDTTTEDLAIKWGRVHDKFAWILRSHLA